MPETTIYPFTNRTYVAIAISRGMIDGSESRAAAIEAARRPTDVGPDAPWRRHLAHILTPFTPK